MAAMALFVTNIEIASDAMVVNGHGIVATSDDNIRIYWEANAGFNATPTQVNTAIKNAGIAAAADQLSITVGLLDAKLLFGGVVGL